MGSQLHWIDHFAGGNLAIMAAPKAGLPLDQVILGWKEEGVDVLVSLVEKTEVPGLVEAEAVVCGELSLEFVWFPIRDKSVPSPDEVGVLASALAREISEGKSVAVHCRAGIGRSALVAACVLIYLGHDAAEALDMIAEARGIEVPETEEQRQWILRFVPKMGQPIRGR